MIRPWLFILLVIAALVAVMAAVRRLGTRSAIHPELQRKSVHIGMGLITLTFPWLFDDPWPVVLLAVLAVGGLVGMKQIAALKKGLGGALHGVARDSLGEIYFPLAVALLFVLAGNAPVLYVVPMLVLSLADAVAAVVGVRYGSHPYSTSEGSKSAEGSAAFLLTAFGSTMVPVLLMTDIPLGKAVVGALLVGILVMLFEAVSVGGIDNLFIPLGCYGLLERYQHLDAQGLFYRLIALCLLALVVYAWRRKTTLKGSALLAAVLAGFMNWMMGGWPYLAVSLMLLLTYTRMWPRTEENRHPVHSVRTIAAVAAPGTVWLLAAARHAAPDYLYCFILCYAAFSVITGMLQLGYRTPQCSAWRLGTPAVLRSWIVFAPACFLPYLEAAVPHDTAGGAILAALAVLPLLAIAAVLFSMINPWLGQTPQDGTRWFGYGTIAFTVSLIGALIVV